MDAATRGDTESGHQTRATALRDAAPDDISRIRAVRHVQKKDRDDEKLEMGNAEH
jgi:hypothetical protein